MGPQKDEGKLVKREREMIGTASHQIQIIGGVSKSGGGGSETNELGRKIYKSHQLYTNPCLVVLQKYFVSCVDISLLSFLEARNSFLSLSLSLLNCRFIEPSKNDNIWLEEISYQQRNLEKRTTSLSTFHREEI